MKAPDAHAADGLREELALERERHEAALAQLEILGEELDTTSEQLAIATRALGACRDEALAARRRLHAAVLEHDRDQARIERTLEGSPTTLFEQNLELRYVWACATPFGRRVEEVIGLRDDDLFPREQALALSSMKRDALRALQPIRRILHLTIGGEVRRVDVYVRPLEDDAGGVAGVCGIATAEPLAPGD